MATSVKLDDELKGRVQNLAQSKDRSAHWIMRKAIREYVEREEARDSFRQEAQESWSEYQQTGRHLNSKEVDGWLESWGTDREVEAPECHD